MFHFVGIRYLNTRSSFVRESINLIRTRKLVSASLGDEKQKNKKRRIIIRFTEKVNDTVINSLENLVLG